MKRLRQQGGSVLAVTHAFVIESAAGLDGREVRYCQHVVPEMETENPDR